MIVTPYGELHVWNSVLECVTSCALVRYATNSVDIKTMKLECSAQAFAVLTCKTDFKVCNCPPLQDPAMAAPVWQMRSSVPMAMWQNCTACTSCKFISRKTALHKALCWTDLCLKPHCPMIPTSHQQQFLLQHVQAFQKINSTFGLGSITQRLHAHLIHASCSIP